MKTYDSHLFYLHFGIASQCFISFNYGFFLEIECFHDSGSAKFFEKLSSSA